MNSSTSSPSIQAPHEPRVALGNSGHALGFLGLYATHAMGANELVVEYMKEVVRLAVAQQRVAENQRAKCPGEREGSTGIIDSPAIVIIALARHTALGSERWYDVAVVLAPPQTLFFSYDLSRCSQSRSNLQKIFRHKRCLVFATVPK